MISSVIAGDLDVHLQRGDAVIGARYLEPCSRDDPRAKESDRTAKRVSLQN